MRRSSQKVIFAVAFSLVIHGTLGAALFYNLSNDFSFSKIPNKISLVWVSLEAKEITAITAKDIRPVAEDPRNSAEQKQAAKDSPEILRSNKTVVETNPLPGFAGSAIVSDSHGPAAAVIKEQTYHLPGTAAGRSAASLSASAADAYPLYRENMPPVYPEIARARGYEGVVLVYAEILPDGRVGNMKIRKSSGYAILDKSAVEAVKPWKFEPARRSGKPMTVWVELPIKFVLQDDNNSQS
jgi:TonB family protein